MEQTNRGQLLKPMEQTNRGQLLKPMEQTNRGQLLKPIEQIARGQLLKYTEQMNGEGASCRRINTGSSYYDPQISVRRCTHCCQQS